MPTKNPRINITLDPATAGLLSSMAKEEHLSVAHLAKDLILEALERREDKVLSGIAELRDKKSAKVVDHESAWK